MDVSSPDVQPSSASTTALHSTALNHDEMDCSDFPTPTNIIPVLLRISAAFYGTLPIPETSFVMACKKIQVLLYFSFGQDTTPLQQLKLVDVIENAVIAFILRVFPSITVGKLPEPAFLPCLSVPVTLISLLGAVDMHIRKYADFTLQLRMAAIYQLLRDNEEVTMLLTILPAEPQSLSLQIDQSFSGLWMVHDTLHNPTLTQYTNPQQPDSPKPSSLALDKPDVDDTPTRSAWSTVCSSLQDLPNFLHPSISGATMSLRGPLPPKFSRSYSAPDIRAALPADVQTSPSVHRNQIKLTAWQNTTRTLPPSLFTPDSNDPSPAMETDTSIFNLLGLRQPEASSISSDLPQPQTQSASPMSSQAFTILDDPFYNTFHTVTDAVSSKRVDSSQARRSRMPILDNGSNLVVTDLSLPSLPKPLDDVKKTQGRSKNQVASDNIHRIAGRIQRRAISMHSMDKENREV